MSTLETFLLEPTKQTSYMKEYSNSYYSLPAAPEYSMGEVCLASLTRALGSQVEESEVYLKNSLAGSFIRTYLESRWENFKQRFDLKDDIFNYLKSPLAGQSP